MAKGKKRKQADANSDPAQNPAPQLDQPIIEPPTKRTKTRRELFVRGLAPQATNEYLVRHFSDAFPVKHGVVVTNPETGQCKGYGFVSFADADDAAQALSQFQNSALLDRKLKLEVAERRRRDVDDTLPPEVAAASGKHRSVPAPEAIAAKERRKAELDAQRRDSRSPKLIVRNLPWSVKTEKDLEKLFSSYGKVKQAILPKKGPGLLKGFGFVVLRGKKNAKNAVSGVNGKEVDGRTLAVDWAVDKDVWEKQMKKLEGNEKASNNNRIDGSNSESTSLESESDTGIDGDDPSHINGASESLSDQESNGAKINTEISKYDTASTGDSHRTDSEKTASTLFVRNLAFTTSEEQLRDHFSQFGPVRYVKIVLDPGTQRSKGTAFVCFRNIDDSKKCLGGSPRQERNQAMSIAEQSILKNGEVDPTGQYTLDGRVLQLTRAVEKSEAQLLAESGSSTREKHNKDKRRLYLLNEGTINSTSALSETLSPSERAIREASYKQRKTLIENNPTLHLSLTRLSIRNIPRTVTSQDLKQLAREAVVGFARDVKAGKREKLSKEELQRDAGIVTEAEKLRKQKHKGIVKQAKVVFESKEGTKVEEKDGKEGSRSRGYGFIEYYTHRSALLGLGWLNGHAVGYKARENQKGKRVSKEEQQERKKRLIVEFAIENVQVVHRRADREIRARNRQKEIPEADNAPGTSRVGNKTSETSLNPNTNARPNEEPSIEMDKDLEKLRKRQRIIGRKRARRREKRGSVAA